MSQFWVFNPFDPISVPISCFLWSRAVMPNPCAAAHLSHTSCVTLVLMSVVLCLQPHAVHGFCHDLLLRCAATQKRLTTTGLDYQKPQTDSKQSNQLSWISIKPIWNNFHPIACLILSLTSHHWILITLFHPNGQSHIHSMLVNESIPNQIVKCRPIDYQWLLNPQTLIS
jgi:hypothetical protein